LKEWVDVVRARPLFIMPVLGSPVAEVTSTSPTGGPIRLRIGPDGVSGVEPASAVVSILLPDGPFDDDVRQSFCHLVHFFGSPAAADAWTAQHPGTFWLPVADARGRASAGGPGPRRGQRRLTATRAERRLAAMPGRG
jgi:alkylmercury lyase